jgi:GntR family transcriptional regulator
MLQLDYRDARPIYEQVKDGLRRLVVTGAIQERERLPSVRQLAASLAINPNTIQKAYEALEAEGYVYTVPGRGTFATAQTDVSRERREALLKQFDTVSAELKFLGVPAEELARRLTKEDEKTDD